MTELYLILHKVRGAPAFDIAQKLDIADEEGWIIPTSGHRAYPWRWYTLEAVEALMQRIVLNTPDLIIPTDWPDHYQANASPKAERLEANSLLASLGLPTKVHSAVSGTLKRRV